MVHSVSKNCLKVLGLSVCCLFLLTIVFNESNLQDLKQECNYRFSPLLMPATAGGGEDFPRLDDNDFQLSTRSITRDEIIRLSRREITEAAENVSALLTAALNEADHEHTVESWEAQQGLNPLIADKSSDKDGDGFINYKEHLAGSNPLGAHAAPIEIRDTMPQDDAGIINFARVPDQTAVAFLVYAVHGIDLSAPSAVRFMIDDGYHQPYSRDLAHDAVRAVKLNQVSDAEATYVWLAYDRFLEPFMPTAYPLDAVVRVTVNIRDSRSNFFQAAPFEFKIESEAQKANAEQNVPETVEFYESELSPGDGNDAGIAVVAGELAGAKVLHSSLEPIAPQFGDPDELPAASAEGMQAVGLPVNLLPHTVFDQPVQLFIPLSEDVDIRNVGLAYYDGTRWLPAAGADGTVLPGGEGWMVPGSRIYHQDSSPPLIEVQVYHFSAAQAVVFARAGDSKDEDRPKSSGSSANVHISCFIDTVSTEASFGVAGFFLLVAGCGLLIQRFTACRFAGRLEGYKAGKLKNASRFQVADFQDSQISSDPVSQPLIKQVAKRACT